MAPDGTVPHHAAQQPSCDGPTYTTTAKAEVREAVGEWSEGARGGGLEEWARGIN
jgi:hypothetical protein